MGRSIDTRRCTWLSQNYGLDYEETFSPIAEMTTVRSTFAFAAFKGWTLWQLDVTNAFLYGELDREVFMEQPKGKKQSIVALSSIEAEYVQQLWQHKNVWLKRLVEDMLHKVDYLVQIRCDDESAIRLASNPVFHGRAKHIEIRHHYIRENVLQQEIELKSISTNEQVTDIFTKALGKSKFEYY
ncbi:UNVERIFIED_CONTAM: Copia protein [Sesamum calycinum]|uniref:Copia protein n=1 Tax=Sesamum calycinum TaxID=2727403 RepID=A0AAW2QVF9_9LAMI